MLRRAACRTRGVASRRGTLALVGIRGIGATAAAGGVGGGEGGGGVGVVVESVGLTPGRGGSLVVAREVGVREEARRGRGGWRSRRRGCVGGGAEGEEALPPLGGGLLHLVVLVVVHLNRCRRRDAAERDAMRFPEGRRKEGE
jgi:hypothetical protein